MQKEEKSARNMIPSEVKHEQGERLTKKHIQTLGYVQELIKENKHLKSVLAEYEQQKLHCDDLHAANEAAQEKIKMIQANSLKRTDEINASLLKKHETELMKLVEEKLKLEQRLEHQTKDMALEIERLQKLNASLEEALAVKSKVQSNVGEMVNQVENLKKQISLLTDEKESLDKSNKNQLLEIRKLTKEIEKHQPVVEKLQLYQQKVKEQELYIKKLENELNEATSSLDDARNNIIKSYKEKLVKANNEIGALNNHAKRQDGEIAASKAQVKSLFDEVENVETRRYKAENEAEELKREIAVLKYKLQGSAKANRSEEAAGSFKDFVAVKRELSHVKTENSHLREQLSAVGSRKGSQHKMLL